MFLKIKCLFDNLNLDEYYKNANPKKTGDAGLDLISPVTVVVPAKAVSFKLPLAIACEALNVSNNTPMSFMVVPRSSMGSKTPLRLSNSIGIIDSGYRGEITGILDNVSLQSYRIMKGDRLFQIIAPNLENIESKVCKELSDTERGEAGFGSTGK